MARGKCKSCGDVEVTNGRCGICNKFVKGFSGNAGRRYKGKKIEAKDMPELGDDPLETLRWLLRSAETRAEKRQAALDLINYLHPKLKSMELKQTTDTKIMIEWQMPDKNNEMKTIEGSETTLSDLKKELASAGEVVKANKPKRKVNGKKGKATV